MCLKLSFVNFGTLNSYLKSAFFSMNRLVDLVYFIDILLTCITMYYDKDNQIWVSDQRLIFIKYARYDTQSDHRASSWACGDEMSTAGAPRLFLCRSWLVPDLITMIPFDVIILSGTGDVEVNVNVVKLLRMMKLLRIWRSSRLQDKLEEAVSLDYG